MFGFLKKLFTNPTAETSPAPASAPGPLGIDELARRLGLPEQELRGVRVSYQEFRIPKRTGGTRTILAPNPQLKTIQRRILHRLLRKLAAHPCATGFERGESIVTNARPHVGQEVVIKLDLRDFFGSTSARRVEQYLYRIGWNAEAAEMLLRLCTLNGALPQGAPTSPRLSNLVNYQLDARCYGLAALRGMNYTRYADDLTFSGPARRTSEHVNNPKTLAQLGDAPARVNDIIYQVKRVAAEFGYRLHTDKKLRIARRHNRQLVTGLVVNDKVQLPRATRRRLRAVEHRLAMTGQATLKPAQLAGWRALARMIGAATGTG